MCHGEFNFYFQINRRISPLISTFIVTWRFELNNSLQDYQKSCEE
jgi:hypothetical protein